MDRVTIKPKEYPRALRNPLKGFRDGINDTHEWTTLSKTYLHWHDIENDEQDGIDKIIEHCNRRWRAGGDREIQETWEEARGVEELNIKVIPRVSLHTPQRKATYWPADMETFDYSSEQFVSRVARLSRRLGQICDQDPRVAYVEMGLIGKWGEQHSPDVTTEMQQMLGDIFTEVFPNKLVMVRHPWDFQAYKFGIYWDSWAHIQQMGTHGAGIAKLGDRWKIAPMGGETAYDWGNYATQPGDGPNDTLSDPQHRAFLIDSIRWLHGNHLGWVANYDQDDPKARAGADEVQKVTGYRFVIDAVSYAGAVSPGGELLVSFSVRNTGSSPFYYNWPVEVSLLDPDTRAPVWRGTFKNLDIRQWLPGDEWDNEKQAYQVSPETYQVEQSFALPPDIPVGTYILSLAILDPAGMLPCARFAIQNYFKGGRHPIGWLRVGGTLDNPELPASMFDDPAADRSLHYTID